MPLRVGHGGYLVFHSGNVRSTTSAPNISAPPIRKRPPIAFGLSGKTRHGAAKRGVGAHGGPHKSDKPVNNIFPTSSGRCTQRVVGLVLRRTDTE